MNETEIQNLRWKKKYVVCVYQAIIVFDSMKSYLGKMMNEEMAFDQHCVWYNMNIELKNSDNFFIFIYRLKQAHQMNSQCFPEKRNGLERLHIICIMHGLLH